MDTLIVFARAPRPGMAKTRLVRDLGQAEAHRLYAALFADTLLLAGRVPARRLLSLDGSAAGLALPPRWQLVQQPELSFGERLEWSFARAFARGADRCVLIGADAPHVRPEWVRGAFAALRTHDVAIGPTHDGGYYLLGLRQPSPWIFEDVNWSTPSVLAETLRLVREHGNRCHLLPEEFDVDTGEEAQRLCTLLRREPERAPATARTLNEVLWSLIA
ncbi:MAG TPA: TIGR04282 family arsenosugar biosynthesis glycosyltransferase [Dehalococcoidia bacterium]|nr:TIGR04282 family arsenosugar biosynthesis glycosyltransferase [Dehalococcoidia bacterium]